MRDHLEAWIPTLVIGHNPVLRGSALAVLLLAFPLVVGALAEADERHAALLGMEAAPCPIRLVAGDHACPGCGLSRSTVLAVHGELSRSWRVHAAGILILLLCVGGIAVHAHILATRRRSRWHERVLRFGRRLFALGLLGAWILHLPL